MLNDNLLDRILVAAEVAEQSGFRGTCDALLAIAADMESSSTFATHERNSKERWEIFARDVRFIH